RINALGVGAPETTMISNCRWLISDWRVRSVLMATLASSRFKRLILIRTKRFIKRRFSITIRGSHSHGSEMFMRSLIFRSLFLLITSTTLMTASSAPQVKTKSGAVEGKDDGKVKTFLGIPYATPPVGDLRWKAPQPIAKWSGVKKATEFGSHCMQGNV